MNEHKNRRAFAILRLIVIRKKVSMGKDKQ